MIARQLEALAGQSEASSIEVVISDNGSTDETVNICRQFAPRFGRFLIIDSGDKPGVCHARNAGVLASGGTYILFCDHDDEVHPNYVRAMCRGLQEFDLVGGLAVSEGLPGELGKFENHTPLRKVMNYLDTATGASLGVRRTVFMSVRGFDLSFQKGADETDFCWRVQRSGFTLGAVSDAVVSYRQRERPLDAAKQFFYYGRTYVQLWARYRDVAPLQGVSLWQSIRELAFAIRHSPRLLKPERRFTEARDLGWALGTLQGLWMYRIAGRPPAPRLLGH